MGPAYGDRSRAKHQALALARDEAHFPEPAPAGSFLSALSALSALSSSPLSFLSFLGSCLACSTFQPLAARSLTRPLSPTRCAAPTQTKSGVFALSLSQPSIFSTIFTFRSSIILSKNAFEPADSALAWEVSL